MTSPDQPSPSDSNATHAREPRRWRNYSRAEKYAFIQHQVLFLVLYVVAIYLVATRVGVGTAVFAVAGGLFVIIAGTILGMRRRQNRSR